MLLQWSVPSSRESNWCLQPLTAGHAPLVLDLLRVAFARTEVPLNPPPGALSETVDSLATQILRGGGAGANSGGRLIGSVLWTVADGLYVSRIAVSLEWRQRGIGSALLAACDDEAARRRLRRLHLRVLYLRATCGYLRGSAIGSLPGHHPTAIHRLGE